MCNLKSASRLLLEPAEEFDRLRVVVGRLQLRVKFLFFTRDPAVSELRQDLLDPGRAVRVRAAHLLKL